MTDITELTNKITEMFRMYRDLSVTITQLTNLYKQWKKQVEEILTDILKDVDVDVYIPIDTQDLILTISRFSTGRVRIRISFKKGLDFYKRYGIPYEAEAIIGDKRNIKHAIALAHNINDIIAGINKYIEKYRNTDKNIADAMESIKSLLEYVNIARGFDK